MPIVTHLDLPSPFVVGYVRVSSKEQTEGHSLEHQEREIRDFCQREGLELLASYADPGRSGGSVAKRPGLLDLLAFVEQGGVGAIIVWREDRLARRVSLSRDISAKVHAAGTEIIALSPFSRDRGPGKGQEHGTTLRQLQQIMAESELATLRSRIIPGLFTAARQGVRGGHTPMGYHRLPDGRFVIDPALGPVVADAFRAVANGERPTTLLKQITAAGHRRCDGKPISPEQLRHLLRNRFYRGELLYRPVAAAKVISDASSVCLIGHHPALVDEVTFRLVQDRLAAIRSAYQAKRPRTRCSPQTAAPAETAWQELGRNAVDRAREQVRQRGRRIHGIVPPLIATCARCGSRCYCTLQTRGSRGSRYRVPIYLCETHKQYGNAACDQPPALGAEIDAAVEDALRQAITGGRFQSWQPPVLPPLVEGLQAELAEVEKRIERLQKAVAAHARLRGRLDALLAERDDLIARRDRQRTLRRVPSGPRWDSLRDFDGTWSTLDLAQRRDVVGWLVERVGIEDRGLIDISWVAAPMASLTSAPGGGPEEAA